jgi:hypothetical protein
MPPDTPSVTQLSQIIAQVTAPAFLLGAVAAFISVLISRMKRILDRLQALNAIGDDDSAKTHLRADIPRLKRRAALLNNAIFLSAVSSPRSSSLWRSPALFSRSNMSTGWRCFLSSPWGSSPRRWSMWHAKRESHSMRSITTSHEHGSTSRPTKRSDRFPSDQLGLP